MANKTPEVEQKITVEVPKSLLAAARQVTGEGITQAVRRGLERIANTKKYQALLSLKGSCPNLELDLNALRDDS